jgi:hypothetical protein
MASPSTHYTKARKIKKHRVTGVYVTHDARRLRRQHAYRATLAKGVEYGKDAAWGALFFTALVVGSGSLIVGGLMVFG